MAQKQVSLFDPLPSDPFWVKQIKSIPDIPDFDLEFGKRYLLLLYASGKDKFMDFMIRANFAIDDFKELEALDLTKEEDDLLEGLKISVTREKFLRSTGWLTYGRASALNAFVAGLNVVFLATYGLKSLEGPHAELLIAFEIAALSLSVPSEAFLYVLLKHTTKHEIDETKYQELQRAALQLINKFPETFDERSESAKLIKRWKEDEKRIAEDSQYADRGMVI